MCSLHQIIIIISIVMLPLGLAFPEAKAGPKLAAIDYQKCSNAARNCAEPPEENFDSETPAVSATCFLEDFTPRPKFPTDINQEHLETALQEWFDQQRSQPYQVYKKNFFKLAKKQELLSLSLDFASALRAKFKLPEAISFLKVLKSFDTGAVANQWSDKHKLLLDEISDDSSLFTEVRSWLAQKKKKPEVVSQFETTARNTTVKEATESLIKVYRQSSDIQSAEELLLILMPYDPWSVSWSLASLYTTAYDQAIQATLLQAASAQAPAVPSPQHFYLLKRSAEYLNSTDSDPEETSFWVLHEVKEILSQYRTWFIDHPQLTRTLGSYLLDRVNRLYTIHEKMIHEIVYSKSYGTGAKGDLAEILHKNGYALMKVWHPTCHSAYQHIWVDPNGFQVRLKPFTSEVTLGITQTNPIQWNGKVAVRPTKVAGQWLVQNNANEVLKASRNFIIPASHPAKSPSWDQSHPQATLQLIIDQAHLKLPASLSTYEAIYRKYGFWEVW